MAAVGELEKEYEGRVEFEIVSPEETGRRGAELKKYHLASRGHGLVVLAATGEAVMTLAGHQFGRDEILMGIGQVIEL